MKQSSLLGSFTTGRKRRKQSPALLARNDERSCRGWRRRRTASTHGEREQSTIPVNKHNIENAPPSIRILDAAKSEVSVSTLTEPLATPSMPRLLAQDYYEQQAPLSYSRSKPYLDSAGEARANLSEREKMRHRKSQARLLPEKQRQTSPPGSNEWFNRWNESPRGVDQIDELGTSGQIGTKKPLRHANTSQSMSLNETMTSSESLFSSLFEDADTLTQSFANTDDGDTCTVYEGEATLGDDASFGSNTLNDTKFSSDENTPIPYSFRMASERRPKKYQYGVGTPPRVRSPTTKHQARTSSKISSSRHPARMKSLDYSLDYTVDDDPTRCSCLSMVVEELRGSYKDISKTMSQVLYAFSVSPDDLDLMSDRIRDARREVMEMTKRSPKKS